MLPNTGERQVSEVIEGIKPNHRHRYQFAVNKISERFNDDKPLILDCACGIGYGTMMLSDIADKAIGLDIASEVIDRANIAYGNTRNSFSVLDLSDADAWRKKFNGVKFDAIVSIETIEHVPDGDNLIARFAETTDFLIASVPNETTIPFKREQHPFHYRHYTREQFEELLNRHGFYVDVWATQYNKIPGIVYEDAEDGMGFIVSASKR